MPVDGGAAVRPTVTRPGNEMRQLHFGEFSAEIDDSGCHGLYRGQQPVALSDVPRKVLFILLREHPRPVTGKSLLNALWHAGANPSNVAKQVRALRVEMGDEHAWRYISTLKKEGYAFVMPVTEASGSVNGGGADPVHQMEWRLAREKLVNDFRGSCLHDLELLGEAIEECDSRIQVIARHQRMRLHSRFPQEPVLVAPRRMAGRLWASQRAPDSEVASRASDLIGYSRTTPVVVNVGAYAPACISVLHSLGRRYGLQVRADSESLSGRQQILRLTYDDEADFLLAPHAPFLLVGDLHSLDYRWVTPVHAYQQVVLRTPGHAKGRKRRLLVYRGGSPEEQLIARVGIPAHAEPEMVGSLESLLAIVPDLDPGDMVIAWEPLASGLEAKHQLVRLAEFRCWISLYCHKRWQRGAMRALKNQFTQMFASEWIHCRRDLEWSTDCLAKELRTIELFVAGSGLGRET